MTMYRLKSGIFRSMMPRLGDRLRYLGSFLEPQMHVKMCMLVVVMTDMVPGVNLDTCGYISSSL